MNYCQTLVTITNYRQCLLTFNGCVHVVFMHCIVNVWNINCRQKTCNFFVDNQYIDLCLWFFFYQLYFVLVCFILIEQNFSYENQHIPGMYWLKWKFVIWYNGNLSYELHADFMGGKTTHQVLNNEAPSLRQSD